MKRYWLFIGENYYPKDGLWDFHSSLDEYTPINVHNELVRFCAHYKEDWRRPDWYQIFDSVDRKVIEAGGFDMYGKRHIKEDELKDLNDLLAGGGL